MEEDLEDSTKKLRNIRQKENKRRYRARRREYVESLQQRLTDTRDQQVAGMKEVQQAAQKVINNNSRLRALLRFRGIEDIVVESWLRGDEAPARTLPIGGALPIRTPTERPIALDDVRRGVGSIAASTELDKRVSTKSTQTCSRLQYLQLPNGTCAGDAALEPGILPFSEDAISDHQLGRPQSKSGSSSPEPREESRPCMSVSHILAQPNTELRNTADLTHGGLVSGDIECSRAQAMVLPFATSNDKVEALSKKLKESCVGNKRGGCKVKANVMWEILEEAMNEA